MILFFIHNQDSVILIELLMLYKKMTMVGIIQEVGKVVAV